MVGRLIGACGGLLLSACVHVPTPHELLSFSGDEIRRTGNASCDENLPEVRTVKEPGGALEPSRIHLLSWNVQKGINQQWAEDFASLTANQDLVLLQEAHLTSTFTDALWKTGLRWNLARAFDYRNAETGVLTAGKSAPSSVCLIRHDEPLIRVPKSALITTHPLENQNVDLLLINLHGVNFSVGTASFAAQLRDTMELIRSHIGPVVVAGDFNDWNTRRQEMVRSITLDLSLSTLSLQRDDRSTHLGNPVDHVFFRGLDVVGAVAVPVTSSDHNPLLVTFSLPDNPAENDE